MTGFVFLFPGFFVRGANAEDVLTALPEAVGAELEWLAARGVDLPQRREPVEIWEVERIDLGSDVSRGRWVGAFRYERRPTADADVELALARTELVRHENRKLLERLGAATPEEGLSAPATQLTARADDIVLLLSRLGTRPEIELPAEPRERWESASRLADERLRSLLPGDRERHAVFDGEEWTTRKVLRVLAVGERSLHARLAALAGVEPPPSFGGPPLPRQSPR